MPLDQDSDLTVRSQIHQIIHVILRSLNNRVNNLVIDKPLLADQYLEVMLIKTLCHILDNEFQAQVAHSENLHAKYFVLVIGASDLVIVHELVVLVADVQEVVLQTQTVIGAGDHSHCEHIFQNFCVLEMGLLKDEQFGAEGLDKITQLA